MTKELSIIQKLTRLYTFYSPIRKGKNRIALASLNLEKEIPSRVLAKTKDGRLLKVNFDNHFAHFVYFLGEYETAITKLFQSLVEKGDVCLDIGANAGWFTTLFQTLVGNKGQVHSFEPVKPTFELLKENVKLNNNHQVVRLNNFALGDSEKEISLHVPADKPDGHASVFDFGQTETESFSSKMVTLNKYLETVEVGDVDFVKMDIEGAELVMLKGASKLFEQKKPPIFEIEMALDTTKGFGYLPNDLIEFIRKQCDYDFYSIDDQSFKLKKIRGFSEDDPGANVLCVPVDFYKDKLNKINIEKN